MNHIVDDIPHSIVQDVGLAIQSLHFIHSPLIVFVHEVVTTKSLDPTKPSITTSLLVNLKNIHPHHLQHTNLFYLVSYLDGTLTHYGCASRWLFQAPDYVTMIAISIHDCFAFDINHPALSPPANYSFHHHDELHHHPSTSNAEFTWTSTSHWIRQRTAVHHHIQHGRGYINMNKRNRCTEAPELDDILPVDSFTLHKNVQSDTVSFSLLSHCLWSFKHTQSDKSRRSFQQNEQRLLSIRMHHLWSQLIPSTDEDDDELMNGAFPFYDLPPMDLMPLDWCLVTSERLHQVFGANVNVRNEYKRRGRCWISIGFELALRADIVQFGFLYQGRCYIDVRYSFRAWCLYYSDCQTQMLNELTHTMIEPIEHEHYKSFAREQVSRYIYLIHNQDRISRQVMCQSVSLSLETTLKIAPPCMQQLAKKAFDLKWRPHLTYKERWTFISFLVSLNIPWEQIAPALQRKINLSYTTQQQQNQVFKEFFTCYQLDVIKPHAKRTTRTCITMKQTEQCPFDTQAKCATHRNKTYFGASSTTTTTLVYNPLMYIRYLLRHDSIRRQMKITIDPEMNR